MGEHQDEISIVDLYANQKVMIQRMDSQEDIQKENHKENRAAIHSTRNEMQKISNEVWKLKIKIAGYSAVGGAIAAVVGHLIDKAMK